MILSAKASLRCIRFLDSTHLLVGIRSRSNNVGMTSYIRAARAQLLLYKYNDESVTGHAANQAGNGAAGGSSASDLLSLSIPPLNPPSHFANATPPPPEDSSNGGGHAGIASPEHRHLEVLSKPVVIVRRALL